MELHLDPHADVETLLGREWLESNGRDGFASGTLALWPTRRFHGLLLVAREELAQRRLLVSHASERIELDGSERALDLGDPQLEAAPARLLGFTNWPWPTWTYAVGAHRLRRELLCPDGRNAALLRYRLLDGAGPARLRFRLQLTGRDPSKTRHHSDGVRLQVGRSEGWVSLQPWDEASRLFVRGRFAFSEEPRWREGIRYPVDAERGEPCEEDWFSPGELVAEFDAQGHCELVLSGDDEPLDVAAAVEQARARREAWVAPVAELTLGDPLALELARGARAFVSDAPEGATLLAGYPWFQAWGRDTFTALPGLCLVTRQLATARRILGAYAGLLSRGMIPNRLPGPGESPRYEAVDTSLWFVRSVGSYAQYAGVDAFVAEVGWPAVRAIVEGYRRGTRFGIGVDEDGLVSAGAPGKKLTWMDAEYQGEIFTPRRGKPVEVQALWAMALRTAAELADALGARTYGQSCRTLRAQAIASFRDRFWDPRRGFLFDVLDGQDGDDGSLRPNQLFALTFGDPLTTRAQAKRILEVVEAALLTPVGLRSLEPADPRYHGRYAGPRARRDPAYHQGTVWPFLLAPFVRAYLHVHGHGPAERARARAFLEPLRLHLARGCIGQLGEIFDGDPPHAQRGCFAQAWSTGELLMALVEDILQLRPHRGPAPELRP